MGATDLISKLRNDGYSIKADGGYLDIFPAEDLSPEFVKQLKLGKPEILCALRQEEELKRLDKKRESRAIATATNEELQELSSLIEYVASGNNQPCS